jgi:hypothetical protein
MDIFNTKIEDILKFPFKGNDWIHTFGIYVFISFIASLVIIGSVMFLIFGSVILLEDLNISILMGTFFTILFLKVTLLNLYLQGYIVEMIRNIKEGKKSEKPMHNEISSKLKVGLDRFLLGVGPGGVSILILGISIIATILGVSILETNITLGIIFLVVGILMSLFSILLIIFVATMVIPSMLYIYLETNSVAKAYNFKKIKTIIENIWKEFLVLYAVSVLLSIAISIMGQIPCVGFLALTLGTVYIVFITAFLTGKIFVELDKLKLFK